MKKLLIFAVAFTLAIMFFAGVQYAYALETYADSVESFTQGLKKNGDPVDAGRSDPAKALNAGDGEFVSLGYDGVLILKFPLTVGGTLTITTFETTWGSYPEENAEVWVSKDGISYDQIGTASNLATQPSSDPHPSEFDLEDKCVRYVKLVDTTNSDLHSATSDGFDIDAVKADYTEECKKKCYLAGDITVVNKKTAIVENGVIVVADTGDNNADGGTGGDGGQGGSANSNENDSGNQTNTGGDGGAAGAGGDGGNITSSNAMAGAGIVNIVNTNITRINACGCDNGSYCCIDDIIIRNRDSALVGNLADVEADTGDNETDGDEAGNGGQGGDTDENQNGDDDCDSCQPDNQINTGGSGGAGAAGGDGGNITSGNSSAVVSIFNKINEIINRIRL